MVFAEGMVAQLVARGVDVITGGVLADPDDRDLDAVFEGDEFAPDPAESAAVIARDLADDLRDELVDHPGFRSGAEPAVAVADPGTAARAPAGLAGPARHDHCRPAPCRA